MVKKRLKNLVNVALLSSGGGGMFVRVALVCVCGLGAGILGVRWAAAEDLAPDQASAFVGTIRIRGEGETRFAALPPGTIRVDGPAICAHLSGVPMTPCFRVEKIDNRSFRGSVAGLDFAYCDFYQPNPRTHLVDNPANSPARAPIATPQQSMRLSFHE
jgi:hypothetical protein